MPEEHSLLRQNGPVPSPSLREWATVPFRQRRVIGISFLLVLAATLLYAWLSPSYQAHMTVLVGKERIDPVVSPSPTRTLQFTLPTVSEEELNSEVELLCDEAILRTVVKNTGLGAAASLPFWRVQSGDPQEIKVQRAVEQMARHLKVTPVRKTTLIAVTYASSDPVQASRVLQSLASAYLVRHQQLRRPAGEFDFFQQQVENARQKLQESEAQLANFSRDEGVVSAALERDLVLQKLSDADASYRQLQLAAAETAERVRSLHSQLLSLPPRSTTQIHTAENPQLLEKMKSRLLELQLRRTDLLTRFQPSYRLVQEVEQQIAETQAAIDAERLAPVKDVTSDLNANHEWAKAELLKAEVDLRALNARVSASTVELAQYQQEAQFLGARALAQQQLLRNLKADEDNYLLYVNKREEARIGDALDQRGILNVAIVEPPVVPALPARSPLQIALLGVGLATFLSLGSGFAADYMDPSFRTPAEVVIYLGAPVLASLPKRAEGA
jgi:uncharacterized protein involved in exopolysaccharide biosynthesis